MRLSFSWCEVGGYYPGEKGNEKGRVHQASQESLKSFGFCGRCAIDEMNLVFV